VSGSGVSWWLLCSIGEIADVVANVYVYDMHVHVLLLISGLT